MSSNKGFGGVYECYAFKSRLQEYAQKVGFVTPVYQTVMEGPSHEPTFKSTVIVNDVRYDSLPGFYNRKTAEQSAAEVALMEIHKSGQMTECIPTVHQTGLCKNVLQEYCQKMNFAVPSYTCKKLPSGSNEYSCTVEIGGIHYIGAAAKTKKEAEIKVARTALLAIKSSSHPSETNGISNFTVLPGKRKARESEVPAEKVKPLKPNKSEFKKRRHRKKFPRNRRSEAKFLKIACTNPAEVCNSGDNNHYLLEVDQSFSRSATTELPRSQYSECETSGKEDPPSRTCDKTRENLTFEGFSHFPYGEPNVSDHVGWIEENDCLDNIWSNVDSGCGDSQLIGTRGKIFRSGTHSCLTGSAFSTRWKMRYPAIGRLPHCHCKWEHWESCFSSPFWRGFALAVSGLLLDAAPPHLATCQVRHNPSSTPRRPAQPLLHALPPSTTPLRAAPPLHPASLCLSLLLRVIVVVSIADKAAALHV